MSTERRVAVSHPHDGRAACITGTVAHSSKKNFFGVVRASTYFRNSE